MRFNTVNLWIILFSIVGIFQSCQDNEITCKDSNTTRVNDYDTIFTNPCKQFSTRVPQKFQLYETLSSEPNFGKAMLRVSYDLSCECFAGDCGNQATHFSDLFDFYLENVSNRNFIVTCTLGNDSKKEVVQLNAGEKKLVKKNQFPYLYRFTLFNLVYQ
jgi:hypothetical protein